jgi:FHA domain
MATCPLCLFSNAEDATICTRCGKFRFPQAVVEPGSGFEESAGTRTRIVSQLVREVEEDQEAVSRTVRGPVTLPKMSGMKGSGLSTVAATLVSDSDAYSVVSVETTPPPMTPSMPRLSVIRGEKVNAEFPIYNGKNFIGRSSDKPVDIDLTGQEPSEQVWSSRQHALITFERGLLVIEDLNSLNGTFVNRSRLHPGQQRLLQTNDIVQIGTVQFKVSM